MRYALKHTVTGMQEQMVRAYGDAVWEWLCDTFRTHFRVADVTQAPAMQHLANRTRTDAVRAILANVEAQHEDSPDDMPFERRGHGYYWRTPQA